MFSGSTPAPTPTPSPTPTPAPSSTVYGLAGSDTVYGTAASETIFGFPAADANLGKGTRDWLYGGGGNDTFVLGDSRGLFYSEGVATTDGRSDYALIKDFGAGDKIQLTGTMSDYVLAVETLSGVQGTSIFQDTNHNGKSDHADEFVAHVEGSAAALNLTPDSFVFG